MGKDELRSLLIRRIFLVQLTLLLVILGIVVVGLRVPEHLGSFFFAFLAGSLGASLPLLRKVTHQRTTVLERLGRDWFTTLMPFLYGAIMASVTYLLFLSGILTGDGGGGLFTSNLFPVFTSPQVSETELLSVATILSIRPQSVLDFGKLLVWCFVAGYSEEFVVGVLRTLESSKQPE